MDIDQTWPPSDAGRAADLGNGFMTELAFREGEPDLLIPDDDVGDPELSIVIPALDEELTISEFVAWCREGLATAGVSGEVLIVDSSADGTPSLARASGARVLRVPKRDSVARTWMRFPTYGAAGC